MAPSTPYVAEELWERLGMPYSVHHQAWPSYDPALTQDGDGRGRGPGQRQGARPGAAAAGSGGGRGQGARAGAAEDRRGAGGREPRKVIYVPGRLVNIVV